MKAIKFLPFIFLIALTGCEVIGPSAKVTGPKVIVDNSAHHKAIPVKDSKSNGSFCPPGQAKKGRC
ncbi:hypothetical protein [uncultured Psychromonas sp.]|uniref:hypothetical protein n=1 Tax=uncultured Psychromonas sp. TaxID=173974 RepID=UPI00262F8E2B|nr:hypothetical protein [uncultured Psychromonas sp.]